MSAYRQVPYGMPKGRFIWEFDPNIPLLGIMIFLFLLSYVFFSLSGHWVFLKIFHLQLPGWITLLPLSDLTH